MQDPSPAPASCSTAFRLALALAAAAFVAAASWLWMDGFGDTLADVRTLGMAVIAAGLAYALAERFLLLFAVSMAPVLVLLALLAHWLS
jgi:hypothetical protein